MFEKLLSHVEYATFDIAFAILDILYSSFDIASNEPMNLQNIG